MNFQEVATPYGSIVVREVHPAMLPVGKWWHLLPSPINGRPNIITSDFERFKREVADAVQKRTASDNR